MKNVSIKFYYKMLWDNYVIFIRLYIKSCDNIRKKIRYIGCCLIFFKVFI